MNIKKAKDKAKTKAKLKVAAKVANKCAKACVLIALLIACGCQLTPSRSQTLTMRDCTINIYGGSDTNHVAAVEIGTQAMAIENNGTETLTPTQTTDVRPDIDVSVGAAKGGGILETMASRLVGGGSASASSPSASKAASNECADCIAPVDDCPDCHD